MRSAGTTLDPPPDGGSYAVTVRLAAGASGLHDLLDDGESEPRAWFGSHVHGTVEAVEDSVEAGGIPRPR